MYIKRLLLFSFLGLATILYPSNNEEKSSIQNHSDRITELNNRKLAGRAAFSILLNKNSTDNDRNEANTILKEIDDRYKEDEKNRKNKK
jgi:hypothetical protein